MAENFWVPHLAGAQTEPLLHKPREHGLWDLSEGIAIMDLPKLGITLATILEVAGGLAIARRLGCHDVVLNSDRSNRNLPVEGTEDLIECTTLSFPVRIHVDRAQKVPSLLCEAQEFQSRAMPLERLGLLELRENEQLRHILETSINMNIRPDSQDNSPAKRRFVWY